jgi:hypothetical protein
VTEAPHQPPEQQSGEPEALPVNPYADPIF